MLIIFVTKRCTTKKDSIFVYLFDRLDKAIPTLLRASFLNQVFRTKNHHGGNPTIASYNTSVVCI
jgi:hypothetical protein